jgi:hypothetical protein
MLDSTMVGKKLFRQMRSLAARLDFCWISGVAVREMVLQISQRKKEGIFAELNDMNEFVKYEIDRFLIVGIDRTVFRADVNTIS